MNLEQLTKTQIILLALLVSFMTSIATGIVTVSLIEQAPPAVTQTIDRVVERTVERVVPAEGEGEGEQEVITREVQVVVKENDLIPKAVQKVEGGVVRIYTPGEGGTRGNFLGLGFTVSDDGLVVTDGSLIAPAQNYIVAFSDGTLRGARLKHGNSTSPTVLLQLTDTSSGAPVATSAVEVANLSTVQLGQTVFTVSGRERNRVAIGIISDIALREGETFDAGKISLLLTDIDDNVVLFGAPLVDIFGSIIGVYTSASGSGSSASYTPISVVAGQLAEVRN